MRPFGKSTKNHSLLFSSLNSQHFYLFFLHFSSCLYEKFLLILLIDNDESNCCLFFIWIKFFSIRIYRSMKFKFSIIFMLQSIFEVQKILSFFYTLFLFFDSTSFDSFSFFMIAHQKLICCPFCLFRFLSRELSIPHPSVKRNFLDCIAIVTSA